MIRTINQNFVQNHSRYFPTPKQFCISGIVTLISYVIFKNKISGYFEIFNKKSLKFNNLAYRAWHTVNGSLTFIITTIAQKIFEWKTHDPIKEERDRISLLLPGCAEAPLQGLGKKLNGEYPSRNELIIYINQDLRRSEIFYLNDEDIGRTEDAEKLYSLVEDFSKSEVLTKDIASFLYQTAWVKPMDILLKSTGYDPNQPQTAGMLTETAEARRTMHVSINNNALSIKGASTFSLIYCEDRNHVTLATINLKFELSIDASDTMDHKVLVSFTST